MHCLKDDIPCRTQSLDKIHVDVCPRCQGVWLEQAEVKRLMQKLLVPRYTIADELIEEWEVADHKGTLPKDFWLEDKLDCPRGHGKMSKHYFGGSHIGVDQCRVCHGFWLDGGELKAIAREIEPNPELDNAWKDFISDQNNFRKKIRKLSSLPASIASYFVMAKSIPVIFAIAGALTLKVVVDEIIDADRQLGNYRND